MISMISISPLPGKSPYVLASGYAQKAGQIPWPASGRVMTDSKRIFFVVFPFGSVIPGYHAPLVMIRADVYLPSSPLEAVITSCESATSRLVGEST
ncbi:hypothetical protein ATCV1_z821R [Acanthocystis turfacea chlorella virus 1]|uniref:Uncharacterized protein z821R n=1 Tax=Chlorovirus heliozoae TaxID=322019 RepID=A7KA81_9PHYC|nr:hypothetical protein ATCV1_z821R [Acanthocystis turfacea chlorella virus 1]ABT16955.1 hypothetical protein ATCV1_z821R [Acanthocystis turfacea chlorella virus 1]